MERPQNRHLRPWKKGDPNIPISPGRPRKRELLHEIGNYIIEHPDSLDDYFGEPVLGKKRLRQLYDAMIDRNPALFCRFMEAAIKAEVEPEHLRRRALIRWRSPEEILAIEIARARARPGECIDPHPDLHIEIARALVQDEAGTSSIDKLPESRAKTFLLRVRQRSQEREQERQSHTTNAGIASR